MPNVETQGAAPTDGVRTDRQSLNESLSDFQQRILLILAEKPRYGLAIKRELEAFYGTDINHGRLYPNLDTLVEMGLVTKAEKKRDDRTNEYDLTEKGVHWCREDIQYRLGKMENRGGE